MIEVRSGKCSEKHSRFKNVNVFKYFQTFFVTKLLLTTKIIQVVNYNKSSFDQTHKKQVYAAVDRTPLPPPQTHTQKQRGILLAKLGCHFS